METTVSVESYASSSGLAALARRKDGPTVGDIWSALSPIERQESLKSYLAGDKANRESLNAVAATLPALRTFRTQTIRQMTDSRLIEIVARATHLTPGILHDVLLALHLTGRTAMLESFLDLLGIQHSGGVINDGASVTAAVQGDRLPASVTRLLDQYPPRQVWIYLLTLMAMDPDSWGGLRPVVAEHAGVS
jgi:hypothetical protein